MLIKKLILKKILNNGSVAEFLLVKRDSEYEAAFYLNGKYIGGPSLPQHLDPPKHDITHWMGNKPSVGLTEHEADKIIKEVEIENAMLAYQQKIA